MNQKSPKDKVSRFIKSDLDKVALLMESFSSERKVSMSKNFSLDYMRLSIKLKIVVMKFVKKVEIYKVFLKHVFILLLLLRKQYFLKAHPIRTHGFFRSIWAKNKKWANTTNSHLIIFFNERRMSKIPKVWCCDHLLAIIAYYTTYFLLVFFAP